MALEDFLTQSATITVESSPRVPPPRTAMGGADRSVRLPVAQGVPCLVQTLSSSLSAQVGRRNDARANVALVRIYFAADPAPERLGTKHWIEVDGQVYKVTGVDDVNSMGRLWQVDAEGVRP